jgi:anti-anti-sigma factor
VTPFQVHRLTTDTVAIVGEVDASTAAQFADACAALGPHVGIECSRCEFLDSAGISVLLKLRQRVDADGGEVTLFDPSPAVFRVLEVSGLLDVFRVVQRNTDIGPG